jgi:hypothetical protein
MEAQGNDATPYYRLGPDAVLLAVESTGLVPDGRLLPLNSYENRVYQIGLEEADPVVAKFYRPGRWSDGQIVEEHAFALELAAAEIPVIAPRVIGGRTLFHHGGFRFALFPRQGGHAPELDDRETLQWLGRFIGRIHVVGRDRPFRERPALTPERFGDESIATIRGGAWLPPHLESAFDSLAGDLMTQVREAWARAGPFRCIRLHGDCHQPPLAGQPVLSISTTVERGRAAWDAAPGIPRNMGQLASRRGLSTVRDWLSRTASEAALRMLHHAAWLAAGRTRLSCLLVASPRYWEDLVLNLREQLGAMQEGALELR